MPRILATALGVCLVATTSAQSADNFDIYSPGPLQGQMGGVGFQGDWEVQPGSEVIVVPAWNGVGFSCRTSAATQGGAAWRAPSENALPNATRVAQLLDRFGRDGSRLLITVSMQRPATSTALWGGLSLFPATYVGPERLYIGAINGTTALGFHDYAPGGAGTRVIPGTDLTNGTVLVAEIRFEAGPESLRVWVDPAWAPGPNPPAAPPDVVETIGSLTFGSVRLAAGGLFGFDELGIWDVTPPGQPLGNGYCGPAIPNATGAPATIQALGSQDVDDNDLQLICGDMPSNTFGYFLSSMDAAAPFMPPGSRGNLCLGGAIGRHGPPLSSGTSGVFAAFFDLQHHGTPSGPVAVLPGQTWRFQCWFRDNQSGVPTSNFSPGHSIDFY